MGAYASADSFYGTFDQGGNVWEWNETIISSSRGVRGSSWSDSALDMSVNTRLSYFPTDENDITGFRLASQAVPEPSRVGLLGVVGAVWLMRRRRNAS